MLIENIIKSIQSAPNFKDKEITLQRIEHLKKEFTKINKKYQKASEDRLTVSHLLSEVNEELEDSLSNEKRFIASVSHELRTPLTAILGYAELLDDTALNNKQKRYLSAMTQSSDHLLSLVSDLLDVAKIGDNRIELSPRKMDLDDVLTDCANLIRSRIKKEVDFVVDIPMLEYKVLGDDKRIKQIFINILSNAAKFTKKGLIRFYLKELQPLDNNKIKVVINVDDTGDGIPKEIEERLFDPFQSTDKTQGTGLGLYISQEISRMMDGEITVKSEQGIGSSFQVVLVLEKSTQKEIGKTLKNSNIMMFSQSSMFTEQLAKSFIDLNVNFQNHDVIKGDVSSSLVQMVASGRFYNIAVFDIDVFKNNTNNIAGTLKTINPNIKLIALIGDDNDKNLSEFDLIINKPVSYQRFIKHTEEVYAEEIFNNQEVEDYSGLDILIVEDVELNREYEKEMLDNFFSITCDTAENGAIAVEKAKNKSYDAILMDMRMPVMNGLEATRKIREFDKITPIICMSANVYKEDKLAAEASGMNDFIEKPLERSDIESKLLKVLRHEFQENKGENVQRETTKVKTTVIDSGEEMKNLALKHLKYNFNDIVAHKLFTKATVSLKKYVDQIEHSMQAKDQHALIEDFHALKGVLSNIGLKELANIAGDLQTISEKGDFLALVKPRETLITAINKLLNEVVEA